MEFLVDLISKPLASGLIVLALITILSVIIALVSKFKTSIKVTTKGIEIVPSVKFNTGTPYNTLVTIISWCEKETTELVDSIHGIKRRYFKQSKDFAKSSLTSIRERIAQDYARKFAIKYNLTENINGISLSDPEGVETQIVNKAVHNSFYFFKKCLYADFNKKVETPLYILIEENHLINRKEREYEEEIINLADSTTAELRTIVFNYPDPIDHGIAMQVYDEYLPELKNTITNALRNSRTISIDKRDVIDAEKKKYISKKVECIENLVKLTRVDAEDKEQLIGQNRIMAHYN